MRRLWRTRMGNRLLFGGLLLLPGLAACLAIRLDWSPLGWFPACRFRRLTGWRCPACGATRMLAALLDGDPAGAWYFHPLLLLLVFAAAGLLLWLFIRTFQKGWTPPSLHVNSWWWLLAPAAAVGFLLLRNTAWYRNWLY